MVVMVNMCNMRGKHSTLGRQYQYVVSSHQATVKGENLNNHAHNISHGVIAFTVLINVQQCGNVDNSGNKGPV